MSVNRDTNLLSLVTSLLDNVCQIKTKVLQYQNPKKFASKQALNKKLASFSLPKTKTFQDSPSHRILRHMYKALNVDKNKN